MSNVLTFIFVLGLLVIVHEWGHYIAARAVGVRVDRFSIGFGPKIFGRKIGDTDFCVSLLPLGGFVKLAGESADEASGQPWEFQSKSLGRKFAVVFAGPFMNAFLAFAIFSGVFLIGQPVLTSRIGKVLEDAPAREAGLEPGDRILAVNGRAVGLWEELLREIHRSQGPITLLVERGADTRSVVIAPRLQEMKTPFGKPKTVAFVGIAPSNEIRTVRSAPLEAVRKGAERVWMLTGLIFYSLGLMISGALPFKDSVTGPIGIFFMTQEAAQLGLAHLLYFTGALSVSLFVLNLLPIPVLDGGHVLFILIEKIKGSPLKDVVKERATQVGLVALLVLMAFVIVQDIHRFEILDKIAGLFKG